MTVTATTTTTNPARRPNDAAGNAPAMKDVEAGHSAMMRGHRGESVRQLQVQLAEMGYYKGKLDGELGPQTEAALREFQTKHGLKADGMFGKQSMAKIQSKEVQQDHGAPGVPANDTRGGTNPAADARAREYARQLAGEKLDGMRARPWDKETLGDSDKRAARIAESRRKLESVEKYIDRLPDGPERQRLQQNVDRLKEHYSKLERPYYFQGLGSSIEKDAAESRRLEDELKTQVDKGARS